jgi:hypothetical protein
LLGRAILVELGARIGTGLLNLFFGDSLRGLGEKSGNDQYSQDNQQGAQNWFLNCHASEMVTSSRCFGWFL